MDAMRLRVRRVATLELVGSRTARRALAVAVFVVLTTLGAYAAVPLPFTAVPVTLQTLFVILGGLVLGPALGAAAQAAYLGIGLLGAPVFFAGGSGLAHVLGPTGGYLIAYPAAAWLAGMLGPRVAAPGSAATIRAAAALFAATALILLGGAAQLSFYVGGFGRALELGVLPFLVGDGLKIVAALLVARRIRERTLGFL